MADLYAGVYPIAPTPFDEQSELDLEGQKRVVDFMIDAGVNGICILANYSEQFALTDDERERFDRRHDLRRGVTATFRLGRESPYDRTGGQQPPRIEMTRSRRLDRGKPRAPGLTGDARADTVHATDVAACAQGLGRRPCNW